MIDRYCFTKRASMASLLCLLLAAGCSTTPVEEAPQQARSEDDAPGQDAAREPTDAEVMYRVFAGELLGADGDLEQSAAEYLAAALESEDPEVARRATRVAMAARTWQYAAMAADRWVLLQPESLEARRLAIQAMIAAGDYVGAEHQMGELLRQLGSDAAQAWAIIADQLGSARRPEKAWAILERLIEEQGAGGNADALFAQSQLAARMGDLQLADALATRAVALGPDRAELHAWAGRLAVNLEEEQRAVAHYRHARDLQPGNQSIALALAELLKRRGEVDSALAVLDELPDAPATRLARVAFALEVGRAGVAAEIYDGFGAASGEPDPEWAFRAGQAAEMLDRRTEAIAWYEQVHGGEHALVSVLRRAMLMAAGDDLEGARNLLASTRLHRDRDTLRETFLTESQILLNAGQPDEAWSLLTSALDSLPDETQILYGRALVAVRLDRIDDAERDLRQILADEPDNATALNALGYTLADRTERYDEAETLINQAFELEPGEASIIDSMGWVAFRQGRLEEAARYLLEAWARDRNPEIAAHLGEVLWALGREAEALEIWRQGLQRDRDNAVLNETLERLGAEP